MLDFSIVESCSVGNFYSTILSTIWQWTTGNVFSNISYVMLAIVGTWCAIWVGWQCFKAAKGGTINTDEITTQVLIFILVASFLSGWTLVWEFIELVVTIGLWIAGTVVEVTTGKTVSGLPSLICSIITSFQQVNDQSFGILADTTSIWNGLIQALFSFLFIAPWLALWLKMIKGFSVPILRIFAIMLLSAPTAALTTIPAFRKMPLIDVKTLIASVLEFTVMGAMLGLVFAFMDYAFDQMPGREETLANGTTIYVPLMDPGAWVGSDAYWVALFVVLMILWSFDAVMSYVSTKMELVLQRTASMWGSIMSS